MAETNVLWIGNDLTVVVTGLRKADTGAYMNAATVAYEIARSDGSVVGSGSLGYLAGSDGDYRGPIESTVTALVKNGNSYVLTVTASQDGYDASWSKEMPGAYRSW